MRKELDFTRRPEHEQKWFLEQTWCEKCQKADIGLIDPVEYQEDDKVFVEGKCKECGFYVVSEILESSPYNSDSFSPFDT